MSNTGFLWLLLMAVGVAWMIHVSSLRRALRDAQNKARENQDTLEGLEKSLNRRMQRLDTLLSTMSEAVMLVDRDCRVIAANPAAMSIFGITKMVVDRPRPIVWFYRDPDWNQDLSRAMSDVLKSQDLPDMIVGDHVLAPRLAPIGADQALLVCLDVTERSKLARQRDEFMSNLMHDLKTPLTSMLGYARSLASFGEDAEFRKTAGEVIANEAKRVNELLDALLTLDQIRYTPIDTEAHCELSEVMSRVESSVTNRGSAKHVHLASRVLEENLPPLAISEDELMRVLMNVMDNAVRFSPEDGEISVEISTRGLYANIVICDEGPGIPEMDLPLVTERFYRVDKARGRGGHGLGLSIVRELVEMRHGSLELTNLRPHGLRVLIQLPLYSKQESAAA